MRLNIAPHLARAKMTQSALADRVGVNKGFMSEIISGKKSPSVETLIAIATTLNVKAGDLFDDAADPPPPPQRPNGMEEEAQPYTHRPRKDEDQIRALYSGRARNAAITHRASVDMPGFGIVAGDLIVCDLARFPTPGEVAIAVLIDTDAGTAHSFIRRFVPPLLLTGETTAAQSVQIDASGLDVRHPVIGVIRGT